MLRAFVAVCDNNLNVTLAARLLNTTQPSVSKQLLEFEGRIGHPLFIRQGKRFTKLMPLGESILPVARNILLQCDNIMCLGEAHKSGASSGDLRVGTTHTQARYTLPQVVQTFRKNYPKVSLHIVQASPAQLLRLVEDNGVDLAICTEALENNETLRALDSYSWNRCLIVPANHPLTTVRRVTLKTLTKYPLVTYLQGFTGRNTFNETFRRANISPNVAMSAADADVIKTYVRLGVGVGIIAQIAYDKKTDADLHMRSLGGLFPKMQVRIAYHRQKFISTAMRSFIDIFQSHVGVSQRK